MNISLDNGQHIRAGVIWVVIISFESVF